MDVDAEEGEVGVVGAPGRTGLRNLGGVPQLLDLVGVVKEGGPAGFRTRRVDVASRPGYTRKAKRSREPGGFEAVSHLRFNFATI